MKGGRQVANVNIIAKVCNGHVLEEVTWNKILKGKSAGHLGVSIPTATAEPSGRSLLEKSFQKQQESGCLGQRARVREHRSVTLNKGQVTLALWLCSQTLLLL